MVPTLYTARAVALLYAVGVALMLSGRGKFDGVARGVWTVGCVGLFAHVAIAFHFVHRWDHGHVIEHTTAQTAAVVGVRSGAGVYVNYAMMAVWGADVVYWWAVGVERYWRRPRAVTIVLHAFLSFMMFNATVVFGRGMTRYVGMVVSVFLVVLAMRRLVGKRG
jgi:hypothetical protein